MLDVGTNNAALLDDPLYLGFPQRRLDGRAPTTSWSTSSSTAVQRGFPDALIQFEDFADRRTRPRCSRSTATACSASTTTSRARPPWRSPGVYSALTRITGAPFEDLRIMFLGAGDGRHRHRRSDDVGDGGRGARPGGGAAAPAGSSTRTGWW